MAQDKPSVIALADPRDRDKGLWELYRSSRDKRVRNQIAEANRNLIDLLMQRSFSRIRAELADRYREEAWIALLEAVETFDNERGILFSAHALSAMREQVKKVFASSF